MKVLNIGIEEKENKNSFIFPITDEILGIKKLEKPYSVRIKGIRKTEYFEFPKNLIFSERKIWLENLIKNYERNNTKFINESPYHILTNDLAKLENTLQIVKEMLKFLEKKSQSKTIEFKDGFKIRFLKYLVKDKDNHLHINGNKIRHFSNDIITLKKLVMTYSDKLTDKNLVRYVYFPEKVLNLNSKTIFAGIKISKYKKNEYIFKLVMLNLKN